MTKLTELQATQVMQNSLTFPQVQLSFQSVQVIYEVPINIKTAGVTHIHQRASKKQKQNKKIPFQQHLKGFELQSELALFLIIGNA